MGYWFLGDIDKKILDEKIKKAVDIAVNGIAERGPIYYKDPLIIQCNKGRLTTLIDKDSELCYFSWEVMSEQIGHLRYPLASADLLPYLTDSQKSRIIAANNDKREEVSKRFEKEAEALKQKNIQMFVSDFS